MIKFGEEYVDKGAQFYENKYAQLQILHLKKKAAKTPRSPRRPQRVALIGVGHYHATLASAVLPPNSSG